MYRYFRTRHNPNVEIYEVKSEYWGKIVVKHPDIEEDKIVDFLIGNIKEYPETLKVISKEKARDEVKKMFPLYF